MLTKLSSGMCMAMATLALSIQPLQAAPAYMNDAETRQPFNDKALPTIDHKFPRIIMAETQSMAGDLEKFAKYQILTAGGGMIKKVANLQSLNPDLLYFRSLMTSEFLEYDQPYCTHSQSPAFENTASATSGCNVYAGHWLYQAGTTLKKAVNTSATTLPVADATRFQVGEYIVIYDAPAGSFKNAEHAKITGRNTSNHSITVARGFKSAKTQHSAGSIVAQHVNGQSGSKLNWAYNISTQSPKDSNGRTFAQAALEFIKNNYSKDSKGAKTSVKVSGFLFDSDFYSVLKTKKADVNNDLKTDHGKDANGTNWWGMGLENFYQSVRNAFPGKYVITGHQLARSFNSSHGTQMEGWPQSNGFHSVVPEYKTLNSELANYRYYMHHISKGPAATHVLTKTPTLTYRDGTSAATDRPFRFALGMGLLDDGYFGSQNAPAHPDVWYDEFSVITDKSSSSYGTAVRSSEAAIRKNMGWLGKPLGGYTRIYNSSAFSPAASLISPGTFDSDINGWSGDNVSISRNTANAMDGSSSLMAGKHTRYQSELSNARIKGPAASLTKSNWYTLVFSATSSAPREIKANVGGYGERFLIGNTWRRYVMAFQAPASGSSRIAFTVGDENTNVWFDSVYLFKGNPNVFRRDFENGIIVVNGTGASTTVDLGGTFQRIKGTQSPSINNGQNLSKLSLSAWDAGILLRARNSAPTSPSTLPPSTDIDVCGGPSIQSGSDQGAYLWKECNEGTWRMLVSAGGDSNGVSFTGSVTSDQGFNLVDTVSFENNDKLNMESSKIDFKLYVWNKGTDGINMVLPSSSETCVSLNSGSLYLGPDRVPMSAPFDLNTLQQCK